MTLTLTGAGLASPLYLFCAEGDGQLITCEGYYSDTSIPKGAKLNDGTTFISVPTALPAGLFFEHQDDIGHRLSEPLFFLRELHDG